MKRKKMNKSIIALIPARSGSKGVKNKNIRHLHGFELIAYSIAIAKLSKYISRVIVSTDSEEIAEVARSYGAEVPFIRPERFATDDATDLSWIKHALEWLATNEGDVADIIVQLRPTTPYREPKLVDEAIAHLLQSPHATSLRSAHKLDESPYKMFIKDDEYFKPFMQMDKSEFYNLPRQSFPQVYAPNGYVDILRTDHVITRNNLHGENILAFETPITIEIDTEENLRDLEKEDCSLISYLMEQLQRSALVRHLNQL